MASRSACSGARKTVRTWPQWRHEQFTYDSYAESTRSQLTSPDRHIGQASAAATRQSWSAPRKKAVSSCGSMWVCSPCLAGGNAACARYPPVGGWLDALAIIRGMAVWLITGASSGFGRSLLEATLARGDSVAAAARSAGSFEPGERLLPVP